MFRHNRIYIYNNALDTRMILKVILISAFVQQSTLFQKDTHFSKYYKDLFLTRGADIRPNLKFKKKKSFVELKLLSETLFLNVNVQYLNVSLNNGVSIISG